MPHLNIAPFTSTDTSVVCVNILTSSVKFTFGKVYQLFDMQIVGIGNDIQVIIDDNGDYRTYTLYKDCFMSVEEWRNTKLDDVLN